MWEWGWGGLKVLKKKGTFQKYSCPGRHLLVCSFPFFVCEVQSIPMRFYAGFNCCVGFSLEPVGCLSFFFYISFLFFFFFLFFFNVNSHQSRLNKPLQFFYLIAFVSVLIW